MPEFSGAVPLIAAPLMPAALLVLPAGSACGEDRLSLDGFSGLPLGLLGQPSRPGIRLGFTICLASCGFGSLLCGQLGRVPLCRRARAFRAAMISSRAFSRWAVRGFGH